MGMLGMIAGWQCDTAGRRNLNDNGLQVDVIRLPAVRPESEITTLGLIARRHMRMTLGRLSDLGTAVKPCSYSGDMRVEDVLHEYADSILILFKVKPTAAGLTDRKSVV